MTFSPARWIARRIGISRRRLPSDLRHDVWRRFHGRCWDCGRPLDRHDWHVGHLIADSDGGTEDRHNVYASCAACNYRRAARLPSLFDLLALRLYCAFGWPRRAVLLRALACACWAGAVVALVSLACLPR